MNICKAFKVYNVSSVHIKSSTSFENLSWIPVMNNDATLPTEGWCALDAGINELFNDVSFTEGDYDYMSGVLTVENDTVVFSGSQVREVTLTKLFIPSVAH